MRKNKYLLNQSITKGNLRTIQKFLTQLDNAFLTQLYCTLAVTSKDFW